MLFIASEADLKPNTPQRCNNMEQLFSWVGPGNCIYIKQNMVTLFIGGVQMRVGGCSKNMPTLFELDLYEWLFSNQLSKSRKKKKVRQAWVSGRSLAEVP